MERVRTAGGAQDVMGDLERVDKEEARRRFIARLLVRLRLCLRLCLCLCACEGFFRGFVVRSWGFERRFVRSFAWVGVFVRR